MRLVFVVHGGTVLSFSNHPVVTDAGWIVWAFSNHIDPEVRGHIGQEDSTWGPLLRISAVCWSMRLIINPFLSATSDVFSLREYYSPSPPIKYFIVEIADEVMNWWITLEIHSHHIPHWFLYRFRIPPDSWIPLVNFYGLTLYAVYVLNAFNCQWTGYWMWINHLVASMLPKIVPNGLLIGDIVGGVAIFWLGSLWVISCSLIPSMCWKLSIVS